MPPYWVKSSGATCIQVALVLKEGWVSRLFNIYFRIRGGIVHAQIVSPRRSSLKLSRLDIIGGKIAYYILRTLFLQVS